MTRAPTVLHALARDLADLERHPEARAPLSRERAAELYLELSAVKDALGRLVDTLDGEPHD